MLTPELKQRLAIELADPKYAPVSVQDIFATLRVMTVPTVGRLLPEVVPDIVTVLANGLRAKLRVFVFNEDAVIPDSQQRAIFDALHEAFEPAFLNGPSFSINLALPAIRAMLDGALSMGLLTPEWHSEFLRLATYEKPVWPGLTLHDVVSVKEPYRVCERQELPVTGAGRTVVLLDLKIALPEPASVRIEARESADGVKWTEWAFVGTMGPLHLPALYRAIVDPRGLAKREYRCISTAYTISGSFEAV